MTDDLHFPLLGVTSSGRALFMRSRGGGGVTLSREHTQQHGMVNLNWPL